MNYHNSTFHQRVEYYVRQVAIGDIEALSGLFDLIGQRLVRYATSVIGDQHHGEDIVQIVLTKIAMNPKVIQDHQSAWAYLLRMTRNEAISLIRKHLNKKLLIQTDALVDIIDPDQETGNDTKQQVWFALGRLPTTQREVILLKVWEHMTFEEIAIILEIAPGTAASRYRYAMDKLRQFLSVSPVKRNCHNV